jgi:cytochrome c oxidase subunit 1
MSIALIYRTIWWAFGHSSQQINVAAHISIWYAGSRRWCLRSQADERSGSVARAPSCSTSCSCNWPVRTICSSDPGVSTEWKVVNTSYFMYFAVLASMIHGLTIPGAMEVAQRAKGYNKGLFEWLRKAPWGNPVVLRRVHLDHWIRFPRRHLGRDDGHRAAQHDHPQHDLRARAISMPRW